LNAISVELKTLEQQSQQTDLVVTKFCNELGIEPPFIANG
jgi:hypothetical protein